MVVDAPISGMQTSIISGGGLAYVKLGKDSSMQVKPVIRVGPWSLVTAFVG